jgi:hypothetical protein
MIVYYSHAALVFDWLIDGCITALLLLIMLSLFMFSRCSRFPAFTFARCFCFPVVPVLPVLSCSSRSSHSCPYGSPMAPSGSRGGGFRDMIKFTATHNIIIVGLIITCIRYFVVVHTSKTI